MKTFEDNEIIKAVECCIGNTKCGECPMFRTPNCMNKVFGYALDLINRKNAEMERLKEHIKHTNNVVKQVVKDTKSEAIKEFAEKLKEIMFNYYECVSESAKGRPYKGDTLMDYEVVDMIEDSIDNLVKEMTEE